MYRGGAQPPSSSSILRLCSRATKKNAYARARPTSVYIPTPRRAAYIAAVARPAGFASESINSGHYKRPRVRSAGCSARGKNYRRAISLAADLLKSCTASRLFPDISRDNNRRARLPRLPRNFFLHTIFFSLSRASCLDPVMQ